MEADASQAVSCLYTQRHGEGSATGALEQLRHNLPHGACGRVVNGYIFAGHRDALAWQRRWRAREDAPVPALVGPRLGLLLRELSWAPVACEMSLEMYRGQECCVMCCVKCESPVNIGLSYDGPGYKVPPMLQISNPKATIKMRVADILVNIAWRINIVEHAIHPQDIDGTMYLCRDCGPGEWEADPERVEIP